MSDNELIVNMLDFTQQHIFCASLRWQQSGEAAMITAINLLGEEDPQQDYLLPGFIDAHVHIESAMMLPTEFARMAVKHGTIATVSDPHEIANVMGLEGIDYMLRNADKTPFHFFFGAPSCVPATAFETAGASIDCDDLEQLLSSGKIRYLSEMMNYPAVLNRSPEVMAKIALAQRYGVPIDGHAPGLMGQEAIAYAQAGISTDHECTTLAEAREKIAAGMKILIREGSAARDFEQLHPLISEFPTQVMFCSDDKHPDELAKGHINQLVTRALAYGHSVFDVLRCASLNAIEHYQLDLQAIQPGQLLTGVLVKNLQDFSLKATWLDGRLVAQDGQTLLASHAQSAINNFHAKALDSSSLRILVDIDSLAASDQNKPKIRVIDVCEGKLLTREKRLELDQFQHSPVPGEPAKCLLTARPQNNIAQLSVLNRYQDAPVANAFVFGTGIRRGAIASTIAHDSHNIIALGCDAKAMTQAMNCLIEHKGGICVADQQCAQVLPLPVAGLMSLEKAEWVAKRYAHLDRLAKALGLTFSAPFMSLSFLALLVIPELKLSDKGLFDGRDFSFKSLS